MQQMENPFDEKDALLEQQSSEQQNPGINQEKLQAYMIQLKGEQNLPLAIAGGIGIAIAGGIVWAAITVTTEFQIGYMAVAIGFGVGYAVRLLGKGIDNVFGITGAALALLGCLIGNFFSIIGFIAKGEGLDYLATLAAFDYSLTPKLMMATFSPMDILFYGIAIYEGYKFSFREITQEELQANAV